MGTDQSDSRRTATWPPSACSEPAGLHRATVSSSSARSQRAAAKPRRKPTLREFARDIDADFSLQMHQSDLYRTATWPPTACSQPAGLHCAAAFPSSTHYQAVAAKARRKRDKQI